jgi:putative tricarboxylic transport membrane protein
MVYTIINSALIANVFMFIIMVFATVLIARVIFVKKAYLLPVILVCCVIGSFAMANRMFDVWVMLGFGLVGFFLEKAKVPLAPFVIGIVLGPIAEDNLRSGLMGTAGDFTPLFTDPVSAVFLAVAAASLVWPLYKEFKMYKANRGNP